MTDETAQAILALPDDGKFVHRKMIWQGDWTDTDIATYAELKRMARFWLTRRDLMHIVKESAEVPISATDSSCGFCNSYDVEPDRHLKMLDGKECPATVAQRLLDALEAEC